MNESCQPFRMSHLVTACVAIVSCGITYGQGDAIKSNTDQLQMLLRTEGLDLISSERNRLGSDFLKDQMLPPDFKAQQLNSEIQRQLRKEQAEGQQTSDPNRIREWLSQQIEALTNQGINVQKQKEHVERLQLALETSEKEKIGEIAVAVFARPSEPPQRPEGSPQPTPPTPPHGERPNGGRPGFMPPMLMMQNHTLQHQGPRPQMHGMEMHQPDGPLGSDLKRIAALSESAERLAQAGMPDIAHELRKRAEHLKRELAEKQERIQREERERQMAKMREQEEQARQQKERKTEQRRDSAERDDRPALPIRELHEQLEQLRREVHSINEKVSHLTEMIEHHHRAQERRGHHEEMDDDDDQKEDRKERPDSDKDSNADDEPARKDE